MSMKIGTDKTDFNDAESSENISSIIFNLKWKIACLKRSHQYTIFSLSEYASF